ncbi:MULTISPECIES: glycoside hydrolase family 3 N-terminal domain-containing protein [unclassified Enterococcus]|uniref:glycoside hydrolase family 3 N-terminal domain-containing protein n=1 Tax=unclassified Enterococcus TaxID=2608891 RepID=UPI0013E9A42D|nr:MULTISPECIES: glycoside hydrolase family 3 N-terminal domain-containing protein [unclassified Enterococcus]
MNEKKLKQLADSLTIKEKIAQTVQLNGDLFVESDVMNTGPTKELGFPEDFDLSQVGSIYNVNDPKKLKKIQQKIMEKSTRKIPLLFMSDVIYGFRTIFPIPLAQAGSYDFELIRKAAQTTAKESYLNGLHVLFSPMLDLVRDPRWGRVMESPGEDVYTAKEFAKQVVAGYQGELHDFLGKNHVGACIKHFAGYGAPEAGREYNTVDMSNQRLFNEYLPPYQAAIEANCLLMMTAFNVLNGVPSTGNRWLNRDILRDRFGFEGVLVSDYAAVEELQAHGYTKNQEESAKRALEAGVDFDMMTSVYANSLEKLIEKDARILELLDEAVWRILLLKNKLGLFEHPYRGLEEENTGEILTEEAKETATRLVEKSCVLLKNDETLPLKKEQKIAVIGPYGESKLTIGFWASVSGKPQDSITLKEGMEQHFGKEQLNFSKGFNLFPSYESFGPLKEGIEKLNGTIEEEEYLLKEAIDKASASDIIVLTIGEQFLESGEGASKAKLTLPENQMKLIKELAQLNKPIVGVLYTGRPLVLTEIEPYFSSLLLVWYPGTMGGIGIANVLAGKVSPSGRLSMTFPRSEGQLPIYYAHSSTGRPLSTSTHSTRFVSKYIDESNEPLFSFGTGNGYGNVEGRWTSIEEKENDTLLLTYDLTNLSSIELETVLHIYVKDQTASIVQPVKRLVGSQRIFLTANEKKMVDYILSKQELSFYDNDGKKQFEPGEFVFCLSTVNTEDFLTIQL